MRHRFIVLMWLAIVGATPAQDVQLLEPLKCRVGGTAGIAPFGAPGPGGFGGKRGGIDVSQLPNAIIAGPHPSRANVIELLEDDAAWLVRHLHVGTGAEANTKAGPWKSDRYSGSTSLKVAGYQRFHETVAGWAFPIVEHPQAGEYRYIRFAWKKPKGRGVMVQLNASNVDWLRYYAGDNTVGFAPAIQVDAKVPDEWTIVTRDLWGDFRMRFTLTGIAFTAMDEVALFDHVYLGRTVEDLNTITMAHQQWHMRPPVLGQSQVMQLWNDLGSADASVRIPATWALARSADAGLPFLREHLKQTDAAAMQERIRILIANLDSPRYAVREKAFMELEQLGTATLAAIQETLKHATKNLELHTRLTKLLANHHQQQHLRTVDQRRQWQALRIAELAARTQPDAVKPVIDLLANSGSDDLAAEANALRMPRP